MSHYQYIRSVSRALRILELAANSTRGISLHEVAQALQLSKQTAHNIIRTIIYEGFMEKTSPPVRYKLAPTMAALQRRHSNWNRELLPRATPWAIRLARKMQAEVVIGQFVAGAMVGRLLVFPDQDRSPEYHCGVTLYPHGTSLLLQAFMSDSQLRDFRARNPLRDTDLLYWRDISFVDQFLAIIRREGYLALAQGGIFKAAVAIYQLPDVVSGTLTTIKPLDQLTAGQAREFVGLLRQAGADISASIQTHHAQSQAGLTPHQRRHVQGSRAYL